MGKQVLMLLSKLKYIEIEFYPYLKTKYNQTKCFRLFTHLEENSSVWQTFQTCRNGEGAENPDAGGMWEEVSLPVVCYGSGLKKAKFWPGQCG